MRDAILAGHASNPYLVSPVQGSQYIQYHHPTNKCEAIKTVIAVIMLQVTMRSDGADVGKFPTTLHPILVEGQ